MNSYDSFLSGIKDLDSCAAFDVSPVSDRSVYVVSSKLKLRFKIIALDSSNFDESLDITKTLDLLILLHKPSTVENDFNFHESYLYRAIHIHCLPAVVHVLDATCSQDSKKLINLKRILRSKLGDDKMQCVEKTQDYLQLFHTIGSCKRQKSHFKDNRSVISPDKVELVGDSLTFTGYIRQKALDPNQLIHVVGFGDYQIKLIEVLPDILKPQDSLHEAHVLHTLEPDLMKQDSLDQENETDPMECEQTWPTAEELAAEAERLNTKRVIKKLPPGTSEYQGAWIPQDSDDDSEDQDESQSDADSLMKELSNEEESISESASEQNMLDEQEFEKREDSEMTNDGDYDKAYCQNREQKTLDKLREARLEEMFPDEIDTPIDVPARIRFARYRGLKSFKTSPWDPQENLPPEYSRIFQFQNFQLTKRRVTKEIPCPGAETGQYVRVYLSNVPEAAINKILEQTMPPILIGLLKYERKMTVMNLLIKRVQGEELNNPIKSKEELVFYVGFRKFKARPLFSNHGLFSKFKYERFFRDDASMVATIYAPITFPPAPVLVFKENYKGDRRLVASGSVLDLNPNRLIIKRIKLSGHPFKIHSKTAVLRFMFFNKEDVLYFKPVELSSKHNRRGHISEPLGTHGHMKCTFDRKIRSDDCIFMNLYKRVFPKWTYSPLYQYQMD